MAAPHRVLSKRRATITELPLYHSGALLKKYTGEKDFKKYYGELRGSTIFLYTDETHATYTEKLDLHMLKSMEMDYPCVMTPTIFTLSFLNEEVQLKCAIDRKEKVIVHFFMQIECPDKGEEWRGFIKTVADQEIPKKLQLLPGQIERLKQVLEEEKQRLFLQASPVLPTKSLISGSFQEDTQETNNLTANLRCFFDVSRQKAERMLTDNPNFGDIIIRPSASSYAVTLRHNDKSGQVFKNYKVLAEDGVFVIELEPPVTVNSLRGVLDHFLQETRYRLRPYEIPQFYDTRIEVPPAIDRDTKTIPHARVAPMIQTQMVCGSTPPTTPPPVRPSRTLTVDRAYMDVDVPSKPNTRPVEVDKELRSVLEERRKHL